MAEFDLDGLSLSELKKLEKDVAKAIISFAEREKTAARNEVEALARKLGFGLSELLDAPVSKKRSTSEAKYRHPENPALTWTGRGRKPGWIIEGLAAGKSLSDFAL